ncbi:hypothetical protein A2U01_0042951, partial [Trifolium medium]|nr:hypothetical protein [Trifolium medium]
MGFRNLRAFNEALLAKQGWRLITHPTSLVAQMLQAKYYPKEHFLKAKPKHNMSYTWRSILQASWILKKGCYWTVGNGASIELWEDNWIHQRGNASTWSPKPTSTNYLKVQDIMEDNDNGWKDHLIHQLFIPQEAQKILRIPLIDRTQDDTLTWDGTLD